jgi:hypothetical protein
MNETSEQAGQKELASFLTYPSILPSEDASGRPSPDNEYQDLDLGLPSL